MSYIKNSPNHLSFTNNVINGGVLARNGIPPGSPGLSLNTR